LINNVHTVKQLALDGYLDTQYSKALTENTAKSKFSAVIMSYKTIAE